MKLVKTISKTFVMHPYHWQILKDMSIRRSCPQVQILERLLEGDTRLCSECFGHRLAEKIRKAEDILEDE